MLDSEGFRFQEGAIANRNPQPGEPAIERVILALISVSSEQVRAAIPIRPGAELLALNSTGGCCRERADIWQSDVTDAIAARSQSVMPSDLSGR